MGKKLSQAQVRTLKSATETLFGHMQLPAKVHSDTARVLVERGLVEDKWGYLCLTDIGRDVIREEE